MTRQNSDDQLLIWLRRGHLGNERKSVIIARIYRKLLYQYKNRQNNPEGNRRYIY